MSRVAIVVGASSGMGRELARLLVKEADLDRVYAVARREDRLLALKAECGEKLVPCVCDVTAGSALSFISEGETLTYAVYAAGVGYHGAAGKIAVEKQTSLIDLNCSALVRFATECAPKMACGGRMLVLASAAAFMPQPYFAAYAASKSFALSFCRALKVELSAKKISVTAVCPGPVDTEFFQISEPTGSVSDKKKKYLTSPKLVAKKALSGAKKRKSVVTPTLSMKAARLAAKLLPHGVLVKIYKEN